MHLSVHFLMFWGAMRAVWGMFLDWCGPNASARVSNCWSEWILTVTVAPGPRKNGHVGSV